MKTFEYLSNNSGGDWWLSDEDWKKLEKAGWKVYWGTYNADYTDRKYETSEDAESDRWLGCLAKNATKDFNSKTEAITEFERITGQYFDANGCDCCGKPHYMDETTC